MLSSRTRFFIALILSQAASTAASAFPGNTRLGYSSCVSCHVSPTGGGVLNAYGRNSAAEVMSTWAAPTEEEPMHGLLHKWLPEDPAISVGGDVRYLQLDTRFPGGALKKEFLMQEDVEMAVPLTPGVTLVGSAGQYAADLDGNMTDVESRRHYLLFAFNDHVSARVGRFFPAYGIMFEDHTAATRQPLGFDEGQESYNAELAARDERGEVMITAIAGGNKPLAFSPTDGVLADSNGIAARATAYLGKSSQVGVSAMYLKTIIPGSPSQNVAFGPFANIGFTDHLYLLSEVDSVRQEVQTPKIYSYNLLAYEVIKGLHFGGIYERRGPFDNVGGRIQWFPRPHFEIAATYLRNYNWPLGYSAPIFQADTATLLAHYYL